MIWLNREGLTRSTRCVKRVLSKTILHPFRHSFLHWRVAVRVAGTPLTISGPDALPGFRWLDSPRGHFYADPMLFRHEGRTWLFVEDYSYATNDARAILAAEIGPDGAPGPFLPVLAADHHLSYPLVFEHDGVIYMLPETAAARSIRLYRALRFPFVWRFERELFPHGGYDTTPCYRDGTWYFFTTIPERGPTRCITHLFRAESLRAAWSLHPASPIAGHAEGRGAGPIFEENGRLIRPTQCGRPLYGYSLSFDEIVDLDRTIFVERRLITFEPTWHRHLRGIHTYGRVGDVEVIDGCWGVNPYDVM